MNGWGKKGCDEYCSPDLAACCIPHMKPCEQLYLQVWLLPAFAMNILLFPVPWWTLHVQLLQLYCRPMNSLAPGFLLRVKSPSLSSDQIFSLPACNMPVLLSSARPPAKKPMVTTPLFHTLLRTGQCVLDCMVYLGTAAGFEVPTGWPNYLYEETIWNHNFSKLLSKLLELPSWCLLVSKS